MDEIILRILKIYRVFHNRESFYKEILLIWVDWFYKVLIDLSIFTFTILYTIHDMNFMFISVYRSIYDNLKWLYETMYNYTLYNNMTF